MKNFCKKVCTVQAKHRIYVWRGTLTMASTVIFLSYVINLTDRCDGSQEVLHWNTDVFTAIKSAPFRWNATLFHLSLAVCWLQPRQNSSRPIPLHQSCFSVLVRKHCRLVHLITRVIHVLALSPTSQQRKPRSQEGCVCVRVRVF